MRQIFLLVLLSYLRILRQGREDNPLHTDAFNELIENLKEKKSILSGIRPLLLTVNGQ